MITEISLIKTNEQVEKEKATCHDRSGEKFPTSATSKNWERAYPSKNQSVVFCVLFLRICICDLSQRRSRIQQHNEWRAKFQKAKHSHNGSGTRLRLKTLFSPSGNSANQVGLPLLFFLTPFSFNYSSPGPLT